MFRKKRTHRFKKRVGRGLRRRRAKKNFVNAKRGIIKWDAHVSKLGFNPFPQRWQGKFRLICGGHFSTAGANPIGFNGGAYNVFQVKVNDVYSPLSLMSTTAGWNGVSLTTMQPDGITKLLNSSIYQNFTVRGCKVRFRVIPQITADNVWVTMTPSVNTTPNTVVTAAPRPYTRTKLFQLSGGQNQPISMYVDLPKLWGLRKDVYMNDSDFAGSYAQAPTIPIYMDINIADAQDAAVGTAMPFELSMTFYVDLYANHQGTL